MDPSEPHHIELRDGRRLAYAELGDPGGRPVVHCHGSPSSRVEGRLIFGDAASELGVRLLVPDRPGMGRSDFQRGRRLLDWPQDVTALADALGLDDFAVLGSSGGGPYALACGATIRDRVRVVGVLGGLAPLDDRDLLSAVAGPLRVIARLARFAPLLLRALFQLNLLAMRSASAGERMARSFPEPDRALLGRADIRDGFLDCFVESCRAGTRGAVWDFRLLARPWGFDPGTLDVPVLLWHGERDRNVPVAHGRHLERAIPGCRATYYPGDAHLSTFVHHHREILAALAS